MSGEPRCVAEPSGGLEDHTGLMLYVPQNVMVESVLASGRLRFGIGTLIGEPIRVREQGSVAQARLADLAFRSVGWHPHYGLDGHVVELSKQHFKYSRQWSSGAACRGRSFVDGVDACFAVTVESAAW